MSTPEPTLTTQETGVESTSFVYQQSFVLENVNLEAEAGVESLLAAAPCDCGAGVCGHVFLRPLLFAEVRVDIVFAALLPRHTQLRLCWLHPAPRARRYSPNDGKSRAV